MEKLFPNTTFIVEERIEEVERGHNKSTEELIKIINKESRGTNVYLYLNHLLKRAEDKERYEELKQARWSTCLIETLKKLNEQKIPNRYTQPLLASWLRCIDIAIRDKPTLHLLLEDGFIPVLLKTLQLSETPLTFVTHFEPFLENCKQNEFIIEILKLLHISCLLHSNTKQIDAVLQELDKLLQLDWKMMEQATNIPLFGKEIVNQILLMIQSIKQQDKTQKINSKKYQKLLETKFPNLRRCSYTNCIKKEGEEKFQRCSKCKRAFYCSKDCQMSKIFI